MRGGKHDERWGDGLIRVLIDLQIVRAPFSRFVLFPTFYLYTLSKRDKRRRKASYKQGHQLKINHDAQKPTSYHYSCKNLENNEAYNRKNVK